MRKKMWKGIFLLTAALGVTGCSKSQTADPLCHPGTGKQSGKQGGRSGGARKNTGENRV